LAAARWAPATSFGSGAAASGAGGGGTLAIQPESRSRSWIKSWMSNSAYSNSEAQKRASNGQTSTQIPQYMHSEKSIAKRSSTLRCLARPPSTAGSVSLCESM
jgi:hypothetical protein